ncbi:MAG TPA: DsbE family thiol:disulfide interchange protein [Alphaproteobacteria bacterium]|nr:DsbE family thiol:disulfide interchange protein [Alphaproteobacteria bacterium]
MKKLYSYIPLIVFFVLILFFARQLILKEDPSELPSVLLEERFPEIILKKLDGYKLFSVTNLMNANSPSLVNIWSSWCVPCKIEHEFLMRMSSDHNILIYGINYKDKKEDALKVLDLNDNPFYAIGVDLDGLQSINLGVYGVPETFIIDSDGNIRYRHVGPILEYDMQNIILPILDKIMREKI